MLGKWKWVKWLQHKKINIVSNQLSLPQFINQTPFPNVISTVKRDIPLKFSPCVGCSLKPKVLVVTNALAYYNTFTLI